MLNPCPRKTHYCMKPAATGNLKIEQSPLLHGRKEANPEHNITYGRAGQRGSPVRCTGRGRGQGGLSCQWPNLYDLPPTLYDDLGLGVVDSDLADNDHGATF